MEHLTEKELGRISALLIREGLACKKCRAYSHTLTDPDLAEALANIADGHEERYSHLLSIIEGDNAQ